MKRSRENRATDFIEKALKRHGNRFDYSKVEYSGSHQRVCILCQEHGEFYQTPTNHLSGGGCPKCVAKYVRGKYRLTSFDTFLAQAREIHQDKYDYSQVEWKNTYTKITIICPIHGEFTQIPQNHIGKKCGCRKCGRVITKTKVNKYNTGYFIEKAKSKHGDVYDYSRSKCASATEKVEIICQTHGPFFQIANQHLNGHGCPQCNFDQMAKDRSMGKEGFIEKAREIFGDIYGYSKVDYVNGQTAVCIVCPSHGDFVVTPNNHLSKKSGCPMCNESKMERELALILDKLKVRFERIKRFKWLGKQSLDMFLPEYNIAIECQGIQHFKPVDFAGKGQLWAEQLFEKNKKRDHKKLEKCLRHNLKMIYIIDNIDFRDHKYHFDVADPFSGNVCYHIVHIDQFENHLNHIIEVNKFVSG